MPVDAHKSFSEVLREQTSSHQIMLIQASVILICRCQVAVVLLFRNHSMLVVGMFSRQLQEALVWNSVTTVSRVGALN